MLLKDEYSGYLFIYYLKEKSESHDILEEFLNKVHSQGKTVKVIRSDQGEEFGGLVTESRVTSLIRHKGVTKQV